MKDIREILEERGKSYGSFEKYATIISELKSVKNVRQDKIWIKPQDEAMNMIFSKIARLINGDPNHIDSWQDIAGYAQLVVDILEKKQLDQ